MIHDSLKDRTCILGGTDIVPTLLNGDDDMIKKETVEHLDTFKDCRYVFMASCSLHRGLGLDSIRTMMDTVRSF